MEKTSKSKLGVMKTIFFYFIVGILLFYILVELFMPNQTVKIFGFKPYSVLTQSMEPEINVGDLVFIKQVDVNALEEEDIVTFHADINYDGEKEIVTHYIFSVNRNNDGDLVFRTHPYFDEGENIIADPWLLAESDIIGEYNFHIPWVGTVILFLQSPFGIAAMVVNIGVIIAVVVMIKQGKKEEVEGEEKSD